MGFKTINKSYRGSGLPSLGVGIAQHHKNGQSCFIMRLGVDVMEALGISKGDCVAVARGHGRDANKLRVTPSVIGFALNYSGVRAKTPFVRIVALTVAGTKAHEMAAAPHKIVAGALYVELPDWARAKPAKAA